MPRPASGSAAVFVAGAAAPYASPERLTRRANRAAILRFSVPATVYYRNRDVREALRQGSIVEMWYGLGTAQQRVFYGLLPAEGAGRELRDADSVSFAATDFVGQLQNYTVTLADSTASFVDPVGQEIGGLVAHLAQLAIDAQYAANSFSAAGVQGTEPRQFVTPENAVYGTGTVKAAIDSYTKLAFDDSAYPDPPLFYEYHQRDNYLVWRKEESLATGTAALTLTLGRDAVLGGGVDSQPVYTDALVTGRTDDARSLHADRDSSRRWGGRRFVAAGDSGSSFSADSYELAVRLVEIGKHERASFSLTAMRDPFLLHPGDLIRLNGAERYGLASKLYRANEVSIDLAPAPVTTITVDSSARLLTDYL